MKGSMSALEAIAAAYERRLGGSTAEHRERVTELFQRYFDGRVRPLAEALACGAAVSALLSEPTFDPSVLDSQQLEAFHLAFPNRDIEEVSNYSGEALDGLRTAWKGKLFEVKVRDSLNEGEWVGDWHLRSGQKAVLADSPTQPGWDLAIVEADGTVVEQVQLKATNFVSYVESAAARYPDTPILVTAEAAGASDSNTEISTTQVSDAEIEQQLASATEAGLNDSVWGAVLPGLPLALNLYWVAKGNRTPEQAARAVAASTAAIATTAAAGDLLGDLAADVVLNGVMGFGVGFLARKLFGWLFSGDDEVQRLPEKAVDFDALTDGMERATKHVEALGKSYLALPAPSTG